MRLEEAHCLLYNVLYRRELMRLIVYCIMCYIGES